MSETISSSDAESLPEANPAETVVDSARARKSSAAFVAAFMIVVGGAYVINVLGNPYDIFPFGSRGSTNERAWKARRLAALVEDHTPPTVLILGSSRMLQMNPAQVRQITGEPTFNFAIRGGDLLEYDAFFRYAISIGVVPKMIILAVDEQMFMPGEANRMRLIGDLRLFRAVRLKDRLAIGFSILKKMDLRGTARSVMALLSKQRPPTSNRFVSLTDFGLFLEDGFLISKRIRRVQDGTFNLEQRIAEQVADKRKKSQRMWNGEPRIASNELRHLLDLFDAAKELGVQVYVLTPPNHPALEDSDFGEERRLFLPELRERLRQETAARGFVYRDFSDLRSFGGDESGFWDGIHQTPSNMRKMTNTLFGRSPDAGVDELTGEVERLEQAEEKWGFKLK